jgi:hypothetical protein
MSLIRADWLLSPAGRKHEIGAAIGTVAGARVTPAPSRAI